MAYVLVVEDDDDLRDTIKELLELEGYDVRTAANGLEGLQKLDEAGAPCLILLDLMMPVMDGWQFLETLKNKTVASMPAIPITVVSAAADLADVQQRYKCPVLGKPASIDDLTKAVEEHCSRAA